MSDDTTTEDGGGEVIPIRPEGGDSPGLPPLPEHPPDGAEQQHQGDDDALGDDEALPERRRRAAAEVPDAPPGMPEVSPPAAPGAEQRHQGDGDAEPGVGTLAAGGMLATGLAAARGVTEAVGEWRSRAAERRAEAAPYRQARIKRRAAEEEARAAGARERARLAQVEAREQARDRQRNNSPAGGGSQRDRGPQRQQQRTPQQNGPTGSRQQQRGPQGGAQGSRGQRGEQGAIGTGGQRGGRGPKGPDGAGGSRGGAADRSGADHRGDRRTGRRDDPVALERTRHREQRRDADHADRLERRRGRRDRREQRRQDRRDERSAGGASLGQAVAEEAGRRLSERREHIEPAARREQRHGRSQPDGDRDDRDSGRDAPRVDLGKGPPPEGGPGNDAGTAETPRTDGDAPGSEHRDEHQGRAESDTSGAGWAPPPRGRRRRSAWESARDAAGADESVTVTVERERQDRHGRDGGTPAAVTRGQASLPRAPEPHTDRPGTTAPPEGGNTPQGGAAPPTTTTTTGGPPMSAPAPAPGGAPQMSPQHATEATLGGVLDALTRSRGRCMDTYDQCADLTDRAVRLSRDLEELTTELSVHHNLIGRLTTAALTRLAETADRIARQATTMRGRSLHGAEAVEAVHDAMHDAYRPVQQATIDAGLSTPSAAVHNEED